MMNLGRPGEKRLAWFPWPELSLLSIVWGQRAWIFLEVKSVQVESHPCELVWPAAAPLLAGGRMQEVQSAPDRRVLASVKEHPAPSSFLLSWAPRTGRLYPVGDLSVPQHPTVSAGGPPL